MKDQEFASGRYSVDSNKNLYRVEDERVFVKRLKKNVYDIVHYKQYDYLIDLFGDCYLIQEDKFLFGILGRPQFFEINNNLIYTLDTYKRLWICDLTGKIVTMIFTESAEAIIIKDSYILALSPKTAVSTENQNRTVQNIENDNSGEDSFSDEQNIHLNRKIMNEFRKQSKTVQNGFITDQNICKMCFVYTNFLKAASFEVDSLIECSEKTIKYIWDGNEKTFVI